MKIKRISDDEYEVSISSEEINAQGLNLKNLNYTSKALKKIFTVCMKKIAEESSTEFENNPYSIDAIPLIDGSLLLKIHLNTYVEYHNLYYLTPKVDKDIPIDIEKSSKEPNKFAQYNLLFKTLDEAISFAKATFSNKLMMNYNSCLYKLIEESDNHPTNAPYAICFLGVPNDPDITSEFDNAISENVYKNDTSTLLNYVGNPNYELIINENAIEKLHDL